ncbi:plant virulence effector HPE1-like domain-containing protein [Rhizobium sp. 18055]|uniref:plant virulence effector HPE1-like domain-containing protein n=1 Tax=Rhizobium sp. 18055 TaxID=2681403 RepID=UPI00135B73A6|nr:plant virulence effector HPE1-like domain-containing protein [Rhizobium sp. 18055]
MRQVFVGVIGVLMAGSAMASSIDVIGSDAFSANSSIINKVCTTCPPLQVLQAKRDYTVPTLADGALQQSQIRDVNGEKKLYRTEGWMGGSPVVFVTKAPAVSMVATAPTVDGVDTATTSAVIGGDARPVAAGVAGQALEQNPPLDVSSFKLRP